MVVAINTSELWNETVDRVLIFNFVLCDLTSLGFLPFFCYSSRNVYKVYTHKCNRYFFCVLWNLLCL